MSRSQIPPGSAGRVTAGSVLVLAPHPDDEVLGCGGLLLQLLDAGAAVRVLFLTDGSGAGEETEDPAGYAALRRREAAAVAELLGLAGSDHLAVPDGALGEHLEAAAAAVRRALLSQRPDLLLVPSPLEASRDHRAAFAALHRLLAPLRAGGDDPLRDVAHDLQVLVYEINRPAYPDLLVDVSGEIGRLEEAMELYASQGRRRAYWRAALGLRRYRTLTLGAAEDGAAAAEGYRRLSLDDFTTRSPAQLVAWLGGTPELHEVVEGPSVSVVVRTKDRPELLAEALASLAAGTWRRAEVVLVNDGGVPPVVPADYPLPVVRVDLPDNRGRAAAANAGVAAATGDWVAFLDDDDLAAPEHLETLARLAQGAGVRVAYTDAAVGVYELDPAGADREAGWRCVERRLPYSRDFDPDLLLLDNYIPFNTLIVERSLFAEVAPPEGAVDGAAGPFDAGLPFFEDWDFLIRLAARVPFHHLPRVTCEYRHFRGGGHHVLGAAPRSRADFLAMKAAVIRRNAVRLFGDGSGDGDLPGAGFVERVARAVDVLRAELVEAGEAASSARRDAARAHRELAEAHRRAGELTVDKARAEERYHQARGAVAALTEDRLRLSTDLRRAGEEETKLRAAVADQDAHLSRTYAEIERLQTLVADMERTRAWRLHRRIERLRGK
jgi:LmbE family N-acetylglucosaminyl deacetylase/glycosyltransferase involved in cell wall biosynthesis